MSRIDELLEQRSVLVEMASVMYGDLYVTDENFWKSSIERDMFEIESELMDLGYEEEGITPEIELAALLLFDVLKKGGLIPDEEEEDEEI
jgi:hypothetical protein